MLDRLEESGDVRLLGGRLRDCESDSLTPPDWAAARCVLVCTPRLGPEEAAALAALGVARENMVPAAVLDIPGFSFSRYMRLVRSRVSILSNLCWGGLIYNRFRLQFLSPTINLFITDGDYLRMLENLDGTLAAEPALVGTAYNEDEQLRYPVFSLNGVRLHMNHCHDPAQGLSDWKRRCARLNRENLLVTMCTRQRDAAERFQALPYARKVCFVPFPTDLPACCTLDPGAMAFERYVNSFASGVRTLFDPWVLLEEGRIESAAEASPGGNPALARRLRQAQHVVIYGAWTQGRRALRLLRDSLGKTPLGFAVSGMEGNPDSLDGLPVHTLDDWAEALQAQGAPPEEAVFVLALHPRYYGEVTAALRERGFTCTVKSEELDWICSQAD